MRASKTQSKPLLQNRKNRSLLSIASFPVFVFRWTYVHKIYTTLNPFRFATIVMTHLKAQETKRSPAARKRWKLALIKHLHERGYDRSAILDLFTFVGWIMILPKSTNVEFWQDLKIYAEEPKMPYITSVEQIGYDRGVEAEAQLNNSTHYRLMTVLNRLF